MTDEEAKRFRKRAYRRALVRYLKPEVADDYAQQVILGFLERPHSRQSIDQAVSDAARADTKSYRKHRRERVDLSDEELKELRSYEMTAAEALDCQGIVREFSVEDRVTAQLYFAYGYYAREVADVLGCSEDVVKQRLERLRMKFGRMKK